MKEFESVKEYSDRLLNITNKVRLLGSVLNDSRIVEKLLVTVLEKFEATITTLENTKHLSKISLTELLNALEAQEQRRSMRQEGKTKEGGSKKSYPPCRHSEKKDHPPYKCWRRPDAKCSKCNQLGHEAVICKVKGQVEEVDAQELRDTKVKRVRIGNHEHLEVKGKDTVAITSYEALVSYLIKAIKCCLRINNACGKDLFNVKMKGKSFALNPTVFVSRASATEIWHKRLGHFHHRGLLQMQSKKLVERLLDINDDMSFCRASNFGKQHRQPFTKQAWRSSKKLQLVHTDLCGHQRTLS
ncbi:uncharacterized protein LOC111433407 [Cucurbita moschata]|uniref:Uncharacterized protein LOC111433407 n=1 Tax=Cucurbita moschata TaxID=3662 RepID=A0A6J1EE98_CUCMO|nr:uncharacterized protein LOC111433407 [Cucurbita moschata]